MDPNVRAVTDMWMVGESRVAAVTREALWDSLSEWMTRSKGRPPGDGPSSAVLSPPASRRATPRNGQPSTTQNGA